MTEEQARLKQCCGPEGSGHFNMEPYEGRWCVASGCMAWRTTPTHQENIYGSPEAPPGDGWKPGSPAKTGWWWRTVRGPGDGYCGLAGAPQ